ncbi:MAG: hypothetical protein QOG75_990 [Mycobacterium sp.]|jgi:hypothetical protein|nr:hypothetical protein [Mycobacterium sp.]
MFTKVVAWLAIALYGVYAVTTVVSHALHPASSGLTYLGQLFLSLVPVGLAAMLLKKNS